jgi:hypothetical protein
MLRNNAPHKMKEKNNILFKKFKVILGPELSLSGQH